MKQLIVRIVTAEGVVPKVTDINLGAEGKETRGNTGPSISRSMNGKTVHLVFLPDDLHNRTKLLQKGGYEVFVDGGSGMQRLDASWLESMFGSLEGFEVAPIANQPRSASPVSSLGKATGGMAVSARPADGSSGDPQEGSSKHPGEIPQAVTEASEKNHLPIGGLQDFLALDFQKQMRVLDGDVPKAFLEELVSYSGPLGKAEVQEKAFAKLSQ